MLLSRLVEIQLDKGGVALGYLPSIRIKPEKDWRT
jgi:hypothetical protein